MSLVWDYFNRGGSEKLVMLAMADWCNDKGGSLYPSISAIAKKTCTSESQARRVIHSLINKGYILVVGNSTGGAQNMTRHYQLVLARLTPSVYATPSTNATPCIDATPSAHATPSVYATPPLAPMRVTPSAHATQTIINHHRTTNKDLSVFSLPEWVDKGNWDLWMKTRKGKKMLPEQMQAQIKKLEKWKIAGLDYAASLEASAINGWSGLFEPKSKQQTKSPTKENFEERNYGKEITLL